MKAQLLPLGGIQTVRRFDRHRRRYNGKDVKELRWMALLGSTRQCDELVGEPKEVRLLPCWKHALVRRERIRTLARSQGPPEKIKSLET